MKNIPIWLIDALKSNKFKCFECKKIFKESTDLKAIGIRECFRDAGKESLFIEFICPHCKKTTSFELQEMTLIDLSFEILETEENERDGHEEYDMMDIEMDQKIEKEIKFDFLEEDRKKEKSKITIKDIKKSVKFLNSLETHEDFLEAIGLSPEKIKEYRISKNKKRKNNEK